MKKLYTLTENDLHRLIKRVTKRMVNEMDGGVGGGATSTMTVGMSAGNGNGNGYEYDAPVNSGQPLRRNFGLLETKKIHVKQLVVKKKKRIQIRNGNKLQ